MSRPATSAKRQTGEIRRQQIAEAALRIIAAHGLQRLTAAELGREVGIADATIFRHFRDKAEIVHLAVDYLCQRLEPLFPPAAAHAPLERLERFVQDRLRLAEEHGELFALALTSDRLREAAGDEGLAPLRALSQRSFSFVEECLRDAQAEGSVNSALPTGPGAIAVLGAIHTAAALQVMEPDSAQAAPRAVWQAMKTLLVSEPGSATRRS